MWSITTLFLFLVGISCAMGTVSAPLCGHGSYNDGANCVCNAGYTTDAMWDTTPDLPACPSTPPGSYGMLREFTWSRVAYYFESSGYELNTGHNPRPYGNWVGNAQDRTVKTCLQFCRNDIVSQQDWYPDYDCGAIWIRRSPFGDVSDSTPVPTISQAVSSCKTLRTEAASTVSTYSSILKHLVRKCDSGSYINPPEFTCAVCAKDTYKTQGNAICMNCQSYTSTIGEGAQSEQDCVCIKGRTRNGESTGGCSECPKDTYKDTIGNQACVACPDTFSTPYSGITTLALCRCSIGWGYDGTRCILCPVGSYSAYWGNDNCFPCRTNSNGAFEGATRCFCNAGYQANDVMYASSPCEACDAGTYKGWGSGRCNTCQAGTYGYRTWVAPAYVILCQSCPTGKTSMDYAYSIDSCIVPADCASGFADPGDGTCAPCIAGKYKALSGSGACMACPANASSLPASVDGTACRCDPGYTGEWTVGSGGVEDVHTCRACHEGKYSDVGGNVQCVQCPFRTGGSPPASISVDSCLCIPGFRVEHEGGGGCVSCEAGKYSDEYGWTACEACPAFSWADGEISPGESDNITSCVCNAGYAGERGGVCSECPANTHSLGTDCQECSFGSSSPVRSGTVFDCVCDPGYYRSAGAAAVYTDVRQENVCVQAFVTAVSTDVLTCVKDGVWASLSNTDEISVCDDVTVSRCISMVADNIHQFGATFTHADGIACMSVKIGSAALIPKLYNSVECVYFPIVSNMRMRPYYRQANCAACPANHYKDSTGDVACTACPALSSAPAGAVAIEACVCNAGATGPDGGTCIDCIAGKYKTESGSSACIACESGKYKALAGSGACTACPAHASSLPASDADVARIACYCNAGYELITHVNEDAPCSPCAAGTHKVWGSGFCNTCQAGKYGFRKWVSEKYVVLCMSCPSGTRSLTDHASSTDSCIVPATCVSGFADSGDGTCQQCIAGTYQPQVGIAACIACPAHASSDSGSNEGSACLCDPGYTGEWTVGSGGVEDVSTCRACHEGKYKEVEGSDGCANCPGMSGMSPPASVNENSCLCGRGSWGGRLGDGCQDCEAGKYSGEYGSMACEACPEFSWAGAADALGESDSIERCVCNAGYAGALGGVCSACPTNTHSRGIDCQQCSVGSSSPALSSTVFDCVCDPGYYRSTGAAAIYTDVHQEYMCVRAYVHIFTNDMATCIKNGVWEKLLPSDQPTACDQITTSDCKSEIANSNLQFGITITFGEDMICMSMTSNGAALIPEFFNAADCSYLPPVVDQAFSPYYRQANCAACPANHYKDSTGDVACTACPALSSAPAGAVAIEACVCNAGATGPDGGTCIDCIAGKYKIESGSSACTECESGKYSASVGAAMQNMCLACPTLSNSVPASNEQTACTCNAGATGPNGGECVECIAGKYKLESGRVNCTDCGIGTYLATAGQIDGSACSACPTNSNSPSGSPVDTACICNAGSSGPDGGDCALCVAGKYKVAAGDGVCTECGINTYSATVGQSSRNVRLNPPEDSRTYSNMRGDALPGFGCSRSMLGSAQAFCAAVKATGEWMQIDLGEIRDVSGVVIQKRVDCCGGRQYVTKVDILSSNGGDTFTSIATISMNYDAQHTSEHIFDAMITARYIRFVIQAYNSFPSMRAGVLIPGGVCVSCPARSSAPTASNDNVDCTCNAGATGPDGGPCESCAVGKHKPAMGAGPCVDCEIGVESAHGCVVRYTPAATGQSSTSGAWCKWLSDVDEYFVGNVSTTPWMYFTYDVVGDGQPYKVGVFCEGCVVSAGGREDDVC